MKRLPAPSDGLAAASRGADVASPPDGTPSCPTNMPERTPSMETAAHNPASLPSVIGYYEGLPGVFEREFPTFFRRGYRYAVYDPTGERVLVDHIWRVK